jgi:HD superfamily phosphohydrolase
MNIRDPIHGTIAVSDSEKPVVDCRFFQRLRHIRQLGFGDLAFPGATHTRHAHSLGAMHAATRLFDSVFARAALLAPERDRLRQAVRMAVLCHDLGHLPLSHASECIAPRRSALGLPAWVPGDRKAQASHEDFTVRLLLDSELTPILTRALAPASVTPEAVAGLVLGADPPGGPAFVAGGLDYGPLLRQIVSGELDADRMDYLLRDSLFTGVTYGRYDLDWIVENLLPVAIDSRVHLALAKAAIFGFEDFLLSRFHMFVSVYFHHTSVNFDEMLRRFYLEAPGELTIPADPDRFVECDDVWLATALRRSQNRWARRIVARAGFKLVVQATELDKGYDFPALVAALHRAGLEHFRVDSLGVLSKYFASDTGPSLFIVDPATGVRTPVAEYTPLYQRYEQAIRLTRIYCRPDQAAQARALVSQIVGGA